MLRIFVQNLLNSKTCVLRPVTCGRNISKMSIGNNVQNSTEIADATEYANLPVWPKYGAGISHPFTVLIEGNIGSGKTTFLNHFQRYSDDVCLITEPVEKWRNVSGVNLFELMYKDPRRWAMPFQSYVTLTMLQSHTLQTSKRIKLMERSIYSARYCFVENMFKNDTISHGMYQVLQHWFKFIEQAIHVQADLIVYLRTSPEVVYERMKKRARSEESCVPLQYLRELHDLHEQWLIHNQGNGIKVLTLDADLDLEKIGSEYTRSEFSIINASQTTQPQPVLVSPAKRQCI